MERTPLTDPKILLADNRSKEAQGHIAGYAAAKTGPGLTEIDGCSDARAHVGAFVPGDNIIFRPSIAAAGDKSPYKWLIEHPSTKQFMVLQHFADTGVLPPLDCGGLKAKEQRVSKNVPAAEEGIGGYIDRIGHHDIYRQAYREAQAIAHYTEKPILAGAIDHLSGLIHPFVIIGDQGKNIQGSVALGKLHDISFIYRNGIPDLPDEYIPESLLEVLRANRKQVAWLKKHNPELATRQKVQDPDAIILTTSLIPTDRRYTHTFGRPNSNFGIEMPISKKEGIIVGINERAFEQDVMAQLEYPIGNAIQAQSGHGGHGFNKTHRLIIETPNMDLSRKIGKVVQSKPWMAPWLNLPQNQIWVGEVVTGQTRAMETFT